MPRLQVFILCRDRVSFLKDALQSALTQDFDDYEVIVSDNSEHEDVAFFVRNEYPHVKYIRRQPLLSALDHFRVVIEECKSQFAVLFHDDDVMMPGYVKRMIAAFDQHPSVSAVGCNALMLRNQKLSDRRFMGTFCHPKVLGKVEALLEPYLGLGFERAAPFPGYMYRTSAIVGLYLDTEEGGKYSDVSFLMKVLRRGPILWLPEALIQYRTHAGNDTKQESIGQRLRLLRYIFKNTSVKKEDSLIDEFRFRYWSHWLWSHAKNGQVFASRRVHIVAKFVFVRSFKLLATRPGLWGRLLYRLRHGI